MVTVAQDGRFLRTEASGHVLGFAASDAATRELFLPLDDTARAMLVALLDGVWVRRPAPTARRVWRAAPTNAAPVVLRAPFQLEWNALAFDLTAQLPFTGRALPLRVSLFRGNAGLVELCRYRPLVVVNRLSQRRRGWIAARSPACVDERWRLCGRRSGADRSRSARGRARLVRDRSRRARRWCGVRPAGRAARIAARTALSFIERCRQHQPLLCLDASMVVCGPIATLLLDMATQDDLRVCEWADAPARSGPDLERAVLAMPTLALSRTGCACGGR